MMGVVCGYRFDSRPRRWCLKGEENQNLKATFRYWMGSEAVTPVHVKEPFSTRAIT